MEIPYHYFGRASQQFLISYNNGIFPLVLSDCGDDEFTCNDGDCIPDEQQCDGHEDCNEGEDELNCSSEFPIQNIKMFTFICHSCVIKLFRHWCTFSVST